MIGPKWGITPINAFTLIALLIASNAIAQPQGKYAAQLQSECAALLQSAVRRPFGIGWDPALRGGDVKRPTSRPVSMEPLGSPAAGLLLRWSGQFLNQPNFIDASNEAARAIAASQAPTGKIPAMPIFTTSAGGRDPSAIVPDRASTRAALGLLLTLLDNPDWPRDERIERCARRAAQWLGEQATDIGGWPSIHPPDAKPKDATRILRLDDADYRDSCIAMLYAEAVLKDKHIARANEKMMSHLLLLRRDEPGAMGHQLWCAAYKPNGTPDPDAVGAPKGPDLLASRHAMQILLASYLLTGNKQHGQAMDTAANTIARLRRADGNWDRYPEHPETTVPLVGLTHIGKHGLPETIATTTQLKTIGRQRYTDLLAANFTTQQHVAATLVGLTDNPMTLDLPVAANEVPGWLERNADRLTTLDAPLPETLPERVKRLWLLLQRAKAERVTR